MDTLHVLPAAAPSTSPPDTPVRSRRYGRDASGLTARGDVAHRLFTEAGLSCSAIAGLRWGRLVEGARVLPRITFAEPGGGWSQHEIGTVLGLALAELHAHERRLGFGGPADFVVRFRGGSGDPVSRANSIRRLMSLG